ncbi:hypothetical protein ILUMI_02575 [Ignelater luminosus]|uniref:Apyrase n=1 Tax=Ignelater luminosus TaxID=2038154 RepID=A0A8K0DG86_IGNLU|nr:hypothetical protein ILUMI_02575 [Ignelater luminosus]
MFKVFWILSLISSVLTNTIPANDKGGFELHIVHLNDFHARFEETSELAGVCKQNCIGGFSRVYTAIQQLKNENPDAIVLNAGDNFQGTLWYNIYKWNVTQYFLNKLPTDAYTFGNHEFDDKIKGVVPFLDALKAPTVAANIDDSQEPDIQGKYKKSVVIQRGGKKIGVIGVLLSTTDEITSSEKLKFLDEAESVNKEAERLVAEEKVDTIIVLSHCGYDLDQEIARKASPKIGLIVGAHSHTFLYTGSDLPGIDKPAGPYPTIINHSDGRRILVVQASAYAKYLGNISVSYDGDGNVESWRGAPIYLNKSVPQDKKINEEIAVWKEGVDDFGKEVLGKTKVLLDQRSCRTSECNLGDFVADSMVYAHLDTDEEDAWTSAAIAITNAGSLRASIEIGDITFNDLVTTQPFENTFDIGELQGKYIEEFLEFATTSFYNYRERFDINLLQISGIRVVYNLTNPEGSRTQSIKIRCRECAVPVYEPLHHDKMYKIVVNSFLAGGGDGYKVIADNLKNKKIGPRDIDVLRKYIELHSPIIQPLDGRIQIVT